MRKQNRLRHFLIGFVTSLSLWLKAKEKARKSSLFAIALETANFDRNIFGGLPNLSKLFSNETAPNERKPADNTPGLSSLMRIKHRMR